jgi:hypothetical protein
MTIREGTWARVRLHPDCPGDNRQPHRPAEQDCLVQITLGGHDGEHNVFALFEDSRLGMGRYFRPDELVPISAPAGVSDVP